MNHPRSAMCCGGNSNSAQEDLDSLNWILKEYRDSLMLKPDTCVSMLGLDDLEELTRDPELKDWAHHTHEELMRAATVMQQVLDKCFKETRRHLSERSVAQKHIEQMKINANLVNATHPPQEPTP